MTTTAAAPPDSMAADYQRGARAALQSLKILNFVVRVVLAIAYLLINGVAGWGSLLLRDRIGIWATLLLTLTALPTFLTVLLLARSAEAFVLVAGWFGLLSLALTRQLAMSLYRLFNPLPLAEHVHSWSPGETSAPIQWLWDRIVPFRFARIGWIDACREPIVMLLASVGLFVLELTVFAAARAEVSLIAFAPVLSAIAMLADAIILAFRRALSAQRTADQLWEQQAQAASMERIQLSDQARPVEGIAEIPQSFLFKE